MRKSKIISDALIIAVTPLVGYLILKTYYAGAESSLSLPQGLGNVNIYQSVEIGFTLLLTLVVLYSFSEVLSKLVLSKTSRGIRYKRISQISLFISACITLAAIQDSNGVSSIVDSIGVYLIFAFIISIPFSIRDIYYPLIRYRKIKDKDKRLTKHRSDNYFIDPKKYYKSFLSFTSIIFLIIPVLIINELTYNSGRSTTMPSKNREYIIVESNPKQIVLINYGDSWLTARYDESYPNMPAYHREYKIVDKGEMTKYKFTVKDISMLSYY